MSNKINYVFFVDDLSDGGLQLECQGCYHIIDLHRNEELDKCPNCKSDLMFPDWPVDW